VSDGRIKHPCFSFHGSYDAFEDIIDSYDKWIFAQIQLNYVDENVQAGVRGMRYAYERNVGIVIMEPLKGGMLVNNLPPETKKMFVQKGVSPVSAAMNWCYDFHEPAVVLSGVSTLEQTLGQVEIASCADAGKMTEAEKAAIKTAKDNFSLIPCSACEYCQPCPFGVRIPRILSMYNGYVVFGRKNVKKEYQKLVEDGGGADQCTECGACEAVCPQSIEIIKHLKAAHEKMA
jgi:predicted aldo/keto reductase-like oxidoreductase